MSKINNAGKSKRPSTGSVQGPARKYFCVADPTFEQEVCKLLATDQSDNEENIEGDMLQLLPEAVNTLSEFSSNQLQDMLDLAKRETIFDFENVHENAISYLPLLDWFKCV
ncbi:hypothetical protein ACJJTC_005351 [Scirpophaga incertulas]